MNEEENTITMTDLPSKQECLEILISHIEEMAKLKDIYTVDLNSLCRKLGLQSPVYETMDKEIFGKIIVDENSYTCKINEGITDTQKRFTLAHEISHFILHRKHIKEGITEDTLLRDRPNLSLIHISEPTRPY